MTAPVTHVGKYQIIEQVGEGAMGVVYKARDPVLNRTVAIKVMNEGLAQDEALRERFLREAQAAGSLAHPNVVTIFDFGETDGHLYIAMEFIQGADLAHLIEHNAPLSLAARLDIIIDTLNGLAYAHRRSIIHRDIKPANIRVAEDGHARIMDFGVARLAASNLTNTGVMMGTPNYMAPEQISGGEITSAVDIFSVGAVLYELLTGLKPFEGETLHAVLFKIVSGAAADIRTIKPELPVALSDVVNKALAKDPAERYPSATDMANALTMIRAPLGEARVSKTLAHRISHRSAIEKALKERRDLQDRLVQRWRTLAATAAVLLVGVVAAALFWRSGQTSAAASRADTGGASVDPARPGLVAATGDSLVAGSGRSAGPPPVPSGTGIDAISSRPGARPAAARADSVRTRVATSPRTPIAPAPARTEAPAAANRTTRGGSDSVRPTAAVAQTTSGARDSSRAVVATDTARRTGDVAQPPPAGAPAPQPQGTSTGAAAAVTSPPVTANAAAAAAAALEAESRAAIGDVIAAYATAIGSRDVAAIRRAYPGMTTTQEEGWQSFFEAVRSIRARLEIGALEVSGATAVAQLTGTYEFVNRFGRTEQQAVSARATLRRDAGRWLLQAIR